MSLPKHAEKTAEVRAREMERLADLYINRLEETIAGLNARLVTAAQDAEQQQLMLKHTQDVAMFAQEILAVVSHDLRNPLNAITLTAHVILNRHEIDESLHKPMNRIVASASSAGRLINDLLDYSQARLAGGIRIVRKEANIHELAQEAVEEMEFARRGHSVRVRAEGDGIGKFDPDRISQVLLNLIANSLAHSPDNSEVEVATAAESDTLVIRVHNANRSGPIPSALMPTLFQPFKSGAARSGSRTRSVGLGLYIVEQIVKAHGGQVDVSSTDEGTTFTVTIGRAPTSPEILAKRPLS